LLEERSAVMRKRREKRLKKKEKTYVSSKREAEGSLVYSARDQEGSPDSSKGTGKNYI